VNIRSGKNIYFDLYEIEKKLILKEEYNIDWKTLAEMNP